MRDISRAAAAAAIDATATDATPASMTPDGVIVDPDRYEGLVDNLRIWRAVRSAAQICANAPGYRP